MLINNILGEKSVTFDYKSLHNLEWDVSLANALPAILATILLIIVE